MARMRCSTWRNLSTCWALLNLSLRLLRVQEAWWVEQNLWSPQETTPTASLKTVLGISSTKDSLRMDQEHRTDQVHRTLKWHLSMCLCRSAGCWGSLLKVLQLWCLPLQHNRPLHLAILHSHSNRTPTSHSHKMQIGLSMADPLLHKKALQGLLSRLHYPHLRNLQAYPYYLTRPFQILKFCLNMLFSQVTPSRTWHHCAESVS